MSRKLGPRPKDFDETAVRVSPTFQKWMTLQPGEDLRYACRDFVKGYEDDEERLMRRIMIARRNNLKDHAILKKARAANEERGGGVKFGLGSAAFVDETKSAQPPPLPPVEASSSQSTKRRKKRHRSSRNEIITIGEEAVLQDEHSPEEDTPNNHTVSKNITRINRTDVDIINEMDVAAVEATRSYKKWVTLPIDAPFVYNHTYIKGADGHDWLLKKNIWRRMRYRRQNRDKVYDLTLTERRVKRNIGVGDRVVDGANVNNLSEKRISNSNTANERVVIGSEDDETALVSKAVQDAAAVAHLELGLIQSGNHSINASTAEIIDAEAVAALDDPMVVSALDAAAQLAAVAVAEVPFGQSTSV